MEAALASAEVTVEGTFTTSEQAHSPIGLFATVACVWVGPDRRQASVVDLEGRVSSADETVRFA